MGWSNPGDPLGSNATQGWQKSDGTWTFNQNDPDFDDRPEFEEAKRQHGGADGGGEEEKRSWWRPSGRGWGR